MKADLRKVKVEENSTALELPEGWKARFVGTREYVLSPEGDQFNGARFALAELVRRGSSEEELENLRSSMVSWRRSEYLPAGWMFQQERKTEYSRLQFLTSSGELLKSFVAAIKFMEKSDDLYSEEDSMNMNKLHDQITKGGRTIKCEEKTSTLVLPEGWKARTIGKWEYILSPEGDQFKGPRFALAELVRRGYGEEELGNLRSSMDGWARSEYLPPGWIYKYERKNYNSKGSSLNTQFLSPSGELFQSFISVMKHMEKSELYSEENVNELNKLMTEKTKEWRIVKVEENLSPLVLPKGWKATILGSRDYIVSPEGEQFKSSKLALQELLRRGSSEEELENLRGSMVGWERSEFLPAGWMFQQERSNDATRLKFLTSTGELLSSYLSAITFMENSKLYSEEDSNQISKLHEQTTKGGRTTKFEEKKSSLVLPEGWKARTIGKWEYVLSPEGDQFKGPRFALAEMVRRKYGEEDLENLRNSMDGWERSEYLPPGWIYKYERKNYNSKESSLNTQFLPPSGELFQSFISVKKHMEKSEQYNIEDINELNKLMKGKTSEWRKVKVEDNPSDLVLPEGWKASVVGTREYIVSPEGDQFNGARFALAELVRRGSSEEELENLRSSMVGWRSSENLPAGWMFKSELKNDGYQRLQFLASTGELMLSANLVITFMENSDLYNNQDIEKVNILHEETTKAGRTIKVEENFSSLVLPEGWRCRAVGNKQYVVSPEGDQYNSSRLALVEMVRRGLPEEELENLRDSMAEWSSSELLPHGWRFKAIKRAGASNELVLLSDKGEWVRGGVQAFKIIRNMDKESIVKFEQFSKGFCEMQRRECLEWNEDDKSIPAGWKSRWGKSNQFFISPEGQQFNNRVAILQHMINGRDNQSQIDEMRKCLIKYEGWKESRNLPNNWIFLYKWKVKASSKDFQQTLKIISDEGLLLESYSAAKALMESNGRFDEDDVKSLESFKEENSNERKKEMLYQENMKTSDVI